MQKYQTLLEKNLHNIHKQLQDNPLWHNSSNYNCRKGLNLQKLIADSFCKTLMTSILFLKISYQLLCMQNVITFSWSSWSLLAFSHTMSTFCRSTDASMYWRQSCSSRESLKFKASLYTSIISNTSCTWPEITREKNAGELREQEEKLFSQYFFFYINLSSWNGRTGGDWSTFMEKKMPLVVGQKPICY